MLQPGVADASYTSPQQASTKASRQHILTKHFKEFLTNANSVEWILYANQSLFFVQGAKIHQPVLSQRTGDETRRC
jgi:hypothetical protein